MFALEKAAAALAEASKRLFRPQSLNYEQSVRVAELVQEIIDRGGAAPDDEDFLIPYIEELFLARRWGFISETSAWNVICDVTDSGRDFLASMSEPRESSDAN